MGAPIDLQEAIEKAARERGFDVRVKVSVDLEGGLWSASFSVDQRHNTRDGALTTLALAAGLRTDGTPLEVDDPSQDGTDAAHPAWWRGVDRATAVLEARCSMAESRAAHLRAELTKAQEALRAHSQCEKDDHDPKGCQGVATRQGVSSGGDYICVCDRPECAKGLDHLRTLTYAVELRKARDDAEGKPP